MRSRANFSASSVAASQAFTAASISAAVTRRPPASSSSRSNLCVASIRAASPRAATSSTMARVARSTSAETSRLAPRKSLNARVEIGAAGIQANGHGGFPETRRPLLNGAAANGRQPLPGPEGGPCRHSGWCASSQTRAIARFRVRSLRSRRNDDSTAAITPPGPIAASLAPRSSLPRSVSSHSRHSTSSRSAPPWAEQQKRAAAGGFAGMEFDPDQFQHRVAAAPDRCCATCRPARGRSAAPRSGGAARFPPDSVCSQSSLVMPTTSRFSSCRQTMSDGLDAGILHMGRDHREIVGIERDQFERVASASRNVPYPSR